MKIINGERASGRTTMLIHAAYVTGARIVCPTYKRAQFVAQQAKDAGLDILEPCEALQYAEDRVHGLRQNERILIDDAEKVIEEALEAYFHTPVDAITINRPNVLKSRLDEEQREIAKDLADRIDRVEKKPVTPERLKEAGFEVEPVNVFNPAEESVKRYVAYFLDAKCQNCKHYLTTDEDATTGLCGMNDEIAFGNSYRACFEKREGE